MVIVNKKDGNLRICIDLTKLNLGVKREFYQLESVEETIAKLGGECNYMSKLDCNSGYWQLPLDDETIWSLLLHKRPFRTFVNAGDFQ